MDSVERPTWLPVRDTGFVDELDAASSADADTSSSRTKYTELVPCCCDAAEGRQLIAVAWFGCHLQTGTMDTEGFWSYAHTAQLAGQDSCRLLPLGTQVK